MGSTNFTEHYDIPLPLGSDKTTPMDYNQSMQAVDTALFTAVSNSQSAVEDVTALAGTVTELGEDTTALAGRVTQAEGTLGTQGQAIQSNANRIEEVEDDALDMITAVDEGTAQVATVAVNKDKYFRYNNVLYIATQNIAVGDTIVPNTNCRATNVGTELEAQAGEIDEVKSDLAEITDGFTFTIQGSATYSSVMTAIKNNPLYDTSKVKASTSISIAGYVFRYTGVAGRFCATRFYGTNQVFVAQLNLDLDNAQHCAIGTSGNTFTDLTNIAVDDNPTITVKY